MYLRVGSIILAAIGCVAAAPLAPQAAPSPSGDQAKAATPARDPNEVVCERQKDPGSRLVAAKVCHTRAEWADLRSQDRQMIDQVQTQRGMNGH